MSEYLIEKSLAHKGQRYAPLVRDTKYKLNVTSSIIKITYTWSSCNYSLTEKSVLHMPINETKTVLCGQVYDFKLKYVHLYILPDLTARFGYGYFLLTYTTYCYIGPDKSMHLTCTFRSIQLYKQHIFHKT